MTRLTLVQGPQDPVISLAEAKAHLNVDTSAADVYLTALIQAATAYLDGRDGITGRAFRPQTWRLDMPRFPACVKLPLPPTIAVDSVEYLDGAGVSTVIDPANYRVIPGGFDGAIISPAIGLAWPTVYDGAADAASVIFTAGYVSTSSPENEAIPEPLRVAILMLLTAWYDSPATADIPELVGSLIAPYRLTFLA